MNAVAGRDVESSSPILFSFAALIAAFILAVVFTIIFYVGSDWILLGAPLLENGLIFVAWLIAASGIGSILLRAIQIECDVPLRFVLSIALGLGLMSLLTLGLGFAGLLNRWTAIAIIVFGVLSAVIQFRNITAMRWDLWKANAGFHWLWLCLSPLVGVAILCAMIPPGILWGDEPNGYDVVEYHLQVPREWFEAGRIVPLQHNVFSFFPFNVEMHYLLAMHLLGGPWAGMYLAQMMHAGFVGLTVLAIYALLANRHPRGAIVAAVLAGATPWMSLLAPVAYNEGGLLLFGTLAIGLAIRSLREERPLKWLILAGAMAGFACGCKLTAVTMIAIPLAIAVGIGLFIRNKHRTSNIEHPMSKDVERSMLNVECSMFYSLFIFGLFALITFSPWLIRNMIWTKNAVFPEMTSTFGKAHWTDVQVERWNRANHLPRIDQQNIAGRLRAGWDQILGDPRFGYTLIPLGLFAAVIRRDREAVCLGGLLFLQAIFWLFFTHLQSRFFILSIPISALLIGGVSLRGRESWLAAISLIVAIGSILFLKTKLDAMNLNIFKVVGQEHLAALTHQPENLDGRTLELAGDARAFLYDVPMKRLYYRTVFDVDAQAGKNALQAWTQGWPTGPEVIVLPDDEELARFHRTYWMIPGEDQPQMNMDERR